MKWKSIQTDKPKDGQKVIIWANNLSDPKCSRHYCAVYYEYNDGGSFIDVYPIVWDKLFKSEKEFKNSDLEGDKLQITHWMSLPRKPKNEL